MISDIFQRNLDQAFNPKNNSLGFLRFFFATLVIIQHIYVLGDYGTEPLTKLTNGQISSGSLAVHSFLIISGFLITRSYLTTDNFWRYLWNRFIRIFPGFWFCLIVTSFLFAPFIYFLQKQTIEGYLLNINNAISYVLNNFFLRVNQPDILNLMDNNAEKSLNGSLWTLEWEFILYIVIALLGCLSILKKYRIIVLLIFLLFYTTYIFDPCHCRIMLVYYTTARVAVLPSLFFSGAIFWLYREKIPHNFQLFIVVILITLFSLLLGCYNFIETITLPYIILWIAINLPLANFDKKGDYSYGIYIYHFPIIQVLIEFNLQNLGSGFLFIICFLLTIPLAIISWFLIEKPFINLKKINKSSIKLLVNKIIKSKKKI